MDIRFNLLVIAFLTFISVHVSGQIRTVTPGTIAPPVSLKNVNEQLVSFTDYPMAKGFILVFTCNTCPYSRAYEGRIIQLEKNYDPKGFPVITINPNNANLSPGDSFSAMQKHAKEAGFTFPYLFDEGQKVSDAYGVKATPQVFIIQKVADENIIKYSGAIDNDTPNTNQNKIKWVENAVTALLQNQEPPVTLTKSIGCRVTRKEPQSN